VNKSCIGDRGCDKNAAIAVMQFMHVMHAGETAKRGRPKRDENHPSRERTSGATKWVSSVQTADGADETEASKGRKARSQ